MATDQANARSGETLETLVDVHDLHRRTNLPVSWLYTAAETGRIPSYRCGKYRRFKLSEIEAWLAAQRQG